mmetsp:Transcript_44957/g.96567  ORF Transcript_44957/g.96567 Transcript_44957/m.96567 type:complete len:209 (+) Transcript_44957:2-628(+)
MNDKSKINCMSGCSVRRRRSFYELKGGSLRQKQHATERTKDRCRRGKVSVLLATAAEAAIIKHQSTYGTTTTTTTTAEAGHTSSSESSTRISDDELRQGRRPPPLLPRSPTSLCATTSASRPNSDRDPPSCSCSLQRARAEKSDRDPPSCSFLSFHDEREQESWAGTTVHRRVLHSTKSVGRRSAQGPFTDVFCMPQRMCGDALFAKG